MRRMTLLAAVLALLAAAPARADVFGPPAGKVYTGLSGSQSTSPFAAQVGKRPAVFGFFTYWNSPNEYTFRAAKAAGARLMLHISTSHGYGEPERVTPRGIARGRGDPYLLSLNRRIAAAGEPVYIRLMAEMNQTNNGYCAFNRDGSSRGPGHSTKVFRAAWRRATLILRGGPVADIDAKLAAMRLPPVQGAGADQILAKPHIAMLWVPQTEGSPAIRANAPDRYWPGARYVDWVGTDFYSRFPAFSKLARFYAAYDKPFVFGEWALWGADDPGFVGRFFHFVNTHERVRMLLYNQGAGPTGRFAWSAIRARRRRSGRRCAARGISIGCRPARRTAVWTGGGGAPPGPS